MHDYTILCIDDEENILNSLRRLFLEDHYNILTTSRGDTALDILKKQPVDVLITDQRMPEMKGLEILKKAKVISPLTVRILITGYSDIDVTIAAINEGEIHRYITKPWDNEEFRSVVKSAIEMKDKQFENPPGIDLKRQQQEMRALATALRKASFTTVRALSNTIELKDKYTRGHCDRVLKYSVMIANRLNYSGNRMLILKYAALLHDVGKIGVPSNILNKNGPLNDTEWAVIKEHPRNGASITMEVEFLKNTSRIILEHHERMDGKGYPYEKKAGEILEESRIVAIADVYDALTSTRSYRKAFPMQKALDIMVEGKGTQFDADLVDIFLEEIKK